MINKSDFILRDSYFCEKYRLYNALYSILLNHTVNADHAYIIITHAHTRTYTDKNMPTAYSFVYHVLSLTVVYNYICIFSM